MRHHDSVQMQLSGKNRKITGLAKYSKHDTAGEMYPWLRVTQHLYFIITYWCVWFRLLDKTVKQFNLSWRKASEHLRYTYRNTKIKQGKFCLRYYFRVKAKYSNWNCYSVDYFIEKLNIFTWLNSCSIWFMLGGKIKRTVYTRYKQLQRLLFRCKATFLFSVTLNWIWQCSVLCWTDRMVWKLRAFW